MRAPRSAALFNKWCSDKGTYWLSKHNYGAAYEPLLAPRRWSTRHVLELGVGDETAGSLNTWREYFPLAHFWIVDIDPNPNQTNPNQTNPSPSPNPNPNQTNITRLT